jgi:hypothetical protein
MSSGDRSRLPGGPAGGFFSELRQFLAHHKKWWLTPIILLLAALIALVVFGGSGEAPFHYTIF